MSLPPGLLLDVWTSKIKRFDVEVTLTKSHLLLLGALIDGHTVPMVQLCAAKKPAFSRGSLKVHICRLRQQIAPLQLSILTLDHSYQLVDNFKEPLHVSHSNP